jgi:nucleotide-binding universal stress UspA family protein
MNTAKRHTLHDDANDYLDGIAKRVRAVLPSSSAVTVSQMVLFDVDAAEAITAAAEGSPDPQGHATPPSDVIVMTTHGRGGLALWALGSITERVLSRATRPLFVVRPAAVVEQQATIDVEERQAATSHPTL